MTNKRTPRESVTVEAVMSRVLLTVAEDESVLMAYELARRAAVHHVPVMSADGRCVGLVDLEALRACADSPLGRPLPTVGELADRRQPRVPSASTVEQAAFEMDLADADAVLVVDGEQLVGLVTWRDIVRYVAGTAPPDPRPTRTHPVLFSLEPVIEVSDRS